MSLAGSSLPLSTLKRRALSIGAVKAFDVASKQWLWDIASPLPLFSGVLATKSGLVFAGDQLGFIFAADAKSGQVLWRFQTGSGINASPITYEVDGKRTAEMPMTQSDIARAVPVYEELPGWWEDISTAREFDDLPAKARDYVLRLEELAGAPVSCIGVGPGRDQTIVRRDVLAARA